MANCFIITIRNIFWTLVFFACLVGFIYQGYTFVDIYLEYQTSVAINVKSPFDLFFPSLTFCPQQPVKLSAWCKKEPDTCRQRTDSLDYEIYRSLYSFRQQVQNSRNYTEMVDSGFQLQDLIAYCSLWGTNNCRPWNHFYDNMFGNCYTVNAKWRNQRTEPLKAFSEGMSDIRSRQLNIVFYLDDSEFVDGKNAILTIQPPETSPNTWQEKYVIHAGSKTEFTVTMVGNF
ncbi:uncharacterized protein LOC143245521 [Tachypleus tridentatus]|uniref:uncharacterized protein LOC143245521 n=1 Tax=Tachypleus tridentatus TaxID=6853 RepID=UPI003FD274DF